MALLLSEQDYQILRRVIDQFRHRLEGTRRPRQASDMLWTPEVYVARVPDGGIPALDSGTDWSGTTGTGTMQLDSPGYAECEVYRVREVDLGFGTSGEFSPELDYADFSKEVVYNLSSSALSAGWALIVRDKFGSWFALPTAVGGGGGAAAAFSGARVQRSTDQAIADDTLTAIEFDVELIDSSDYFDAGAPTVLTVPSDGVYHVGAFVDWELNSTGSRHLQIVHNGATLICGASNHGLTSGTSNIINQQNCSGILEMSTGDTVEVYVFQDSLVSLNVVTGSTKPSFWIYRLGDVP